jgi:hypothetical protein
MIGSTESSIIVIATDPMFAELEEHYPIFGNFIPAIRQKLEAGVRVRLVCTTKEAAEHIVKVLPGVEIRLTDPSKPSSKMPLSGGVLMVDDSEVILSIIEKVAHSDSREITAIHTCLVNVISVFRHFTELEWDSAIPLKKV